MKTKAFYCLRQGYRFDGVAGRTKAYFVENFKKFCIFIFVFMIGFYQRKYVQYV